MRIFFICLLIFAGSIGYSQNLITDSSFSDNIIRQVEGKLNVSNYWSFFKGVDITGNVFFCDIRDTVGDFKEKESRSWQKSFYRGHENFLFMNIYYSPNKFSELHDVTMCKLSSPMKRDSLYEIKCLVAGDTSRGVDRIQVFFSQKKISKSSELKLIEPVQLQNSDSSMLRNQNYWDTITGLYRAKGEEQYFYIGNVWPGYKKEFYVYTNSFLRYNRWRWIVSKRMKKYNGLKRIDYAFDNISIKKK